MVGIQSLRSVEDFNLVLISNAYTLELVNLPYLLLRLGLPPMASQRDDRRPPLLLGGSNGMAAHVVVAEDGDSLVDGTFFGEEEEQVEPLVRYLYEHRYLGKRERLAGATARIKNLWATGGWIERSAEVVLLPAPGMDHLLVDHPPVLNVERLLKRLTDNPTSIP